MKFNRIYDVEELLKINKNYIFEYDYFHQTGYHWAAKRGHTEILELLIKKGNHINMYDYNKRTPLWLASKNNQIETCVVLLNHGANPFLQNKEGYKPSEVTSDHDVKMIILENMEKRSLIGKFNYFKTTILKAMKNSIVSSNSEKSI